MRNTIVHSLALDIISDQFGPICQTVANVLLTHGRLQLSHIIERSQLSARNVREALFSLMHHHIVKFINQEGISRHVTFYNIDLEEVLARHRIPKYLWLMHSVFGLEAAWIVELLFRYGRLSYTNLLTVTNTMSESRGHEFDKTMLNKAWEVLLSRNFIIAVNRGDDTSILDVMLDKEVEKRKKLKAGPKAKEIAALKMEVKAEVDEIVKSRYREGKEAKASGFEETRAKKSHPLDGIHAPFKHSNDSTFWRVNYGRMNAEFRNQFMVEEVERLFGDAAADVIDKVLKSTTPTILDCQDSLSIKHFKPDELAKSLTGSAEKLRLSNGVKGQGAIVNLLQQLTEDEYGILTNYDHQSLQVNFQKFSEKQQRQVIEEFIGDRYGQSALRIWRLLEMRGRLDDRQITRLVLQPVKTTREALYQLLKGGFAHIQDVPKTQNDRSAQKTFFLWYVSLTKSRETLLDCCYKSLKRCKRRRAMEEQRNPTLRTKLEREDVKANEEDLLTEDERRVLAAMRATSQRFDAAEVTLDDMIMRLRDFGYPIQ